MARAVRQATRCLGIWWRSVGTTWLRIDTVCALRADGNGGRSAQRLHPKNQPKTQPPTQPSQNPNPTPRFPLDARGGCKKYQKSRRRPNIHSWTEWRRRRRRIYIHTTICRLVAVFASGSTSKFQKQSRPPRAGPRTFDTSTFDQRDQHEAPVQGTRLAHHTRACAFSRNHESRRTRRPNRFTTSDSFVSFGLFVIPLFRFRRRRFVFGQCAKADAGPIKNSGVV
ncbi:hypothetical protein B0H16DRAFT_858659 [Mycena metata]|uniref:Uncharacterized protein n=1 Tax=Mycena metata TaxID=1033252 RepID=A0AAD7N8Y0_9AGAR|nr:hypothetical protein B0H16DRAFT_858659 [Mycena metata]